MRSLSQPDTMLDLRSAVIALATQRFRRVPLEWYDEYVSPVIEVFRGERYERFCLYDGDAPPYENASCFILKVDPNEEDDA